MTANVGSAAAVGGVGVLVVVEVDVEAGGDVSAGENGEGLCVLPGQCLCLHYRAQAKVREHIQLCSTQIFH